MLGMQEMAISEGPPPPTPLGAHALFRAFRMAWLTYQQRSRISALHEIILYYWLWPVATPVSISR